MLRSSNLNITVINGTEKHGVTYHLKEKFLEPFRDKANIAEYYLPKDSPNFCNGCMACLFKGDGVCKDSEYINKIDQSLLQADLIVLTSPVYVYHVTGAMKALLDHFAFRWMIHRPAPENFKKRAVLITQCLGAGSRTTIKDMKNSLSWWGISSFGTFKASLMNSARWNQLPEKRKSALLRKMEKLARKYARIDYSKPARTKFMTKCRFYEARFVRTALQKKPPITPDGEWWEAHGWLRKKRPWKPDSRA